MDSQRDAPGLSTRTSTSLLEGLRDTGDVGRWTEYVGRYRPSIVAWAQRAGVPPADAEDVAQASLLAFCNAFLGGRYDREKGRLRAWLFGIVHKEVQAWRRRRRVGELPAAAAPPDAADEAPHELERMWEEEWHAAVLRQCMDVVRREVQASTARAFELYVLQERPPEEVAGELGMTVNAVYGAKRRVLERVRELMPLMEEIW